MSKQPQGYDHVFYAGAQDRQRRPTRRVAPYQPAQDMRGVVIVEFFAMLAGALPFGWSWRRGLLHYPGGGHFVNVSDAGRFAWAAEYRERPRLV